MTGDTDYLAKIGIVAKAGAAICVASGVSVAIWSVTESGSNLWLAGSVMAQAVGVSMVYAADNAFKQHMSRGTVVLSKTFS